MTLMMAPMVFPQGMNFIERSSSVILCLPDGSLSSGNVRPNFFLMLDALVDEENIFLASPLQSLRVRRAHIVVLGFGLLQKPLGRDFFPLHSTGHHVRI